MVKVIESMSTDKIGALSDDDIRRKIRGIQGAIHEARKASRSTRDLEVEYCYFVREQEVREQRRSAHAKFVGNRERTHRRPPHNHRNPRREVSIVSK
jgi:hypothetical protein